MKEIEQLYVDYNKDIHRFLLKISGYDFFLAEELTQETFYQAFKSLGKFQGRCHIKTWLCQIAKNSYYQHLKKSQKQHMAVKRASYENENKTNTNLESRVEDEELIQYVLELINVLDDRTRDVMLYRLYSELPYAQIALLLGISEGSAKVIFYRGKAFLQAKLREDHG